MAHNFKPGVPKQYQINTHLKFSCAVYTSSVSPLISLVPRTTNRSLRSAESDAGTAGTTSHRKRVEGTISTAEKNVTLISGQLGRFRQSSSECSTKQSRLGGRSLSTTALGSHQYIGHILFKSKSHIAAIVLDSFNLCHWMFLCMFRWDWDVLTLYPCYFVGAMLLLREKLAHGRKADGKYKNFHEGLKHWPY